MQSPGSFLAIGTTVLDLLTTATARKGSLSLRLEAPVTGVAEQHVETHVGRLLRALSTNQLDCELCTSSWSNSENAKQWEGARVDYGTILEESYLTMHSIEKVQGQTPGTALSLALL